MSAPIYFKDLISEVVTNMTVNAPVFLYGHLVDVVEQLSKKTKAGKQKYPLIILPMDIEENFSADSSNYADVSFTIIICVKTNKAYSSINRYSNSYPTLYSILSEFKKEMVLSKNFSWLRDPNKIQHDKIDRLYWGREAAYGNTGNILNDFVDAIEVKNMQVTVKPNVLNCELTT